MLPLYFIALASASAPAAPYATWSLETKVVFGAEIELSTAMTLIPAAIASAIAGLFADVSPELIMIALTFAAFL